MNNPLAGLLGPTKEEYAKSVEFEVEQLRCVNIVTARSDEKRVAAIEAILDAAVDSAGVVSLDKTEKLVEMAKSALTFNLWQLIATEDGEEDFKTVRANLEAFKDKYVAESALMTTANAEPSQMV